MNNPAYESGLKAARATLRAYALAGKVEASIIVNQQNSEHLDFQTGTQDEVTPDWSKVPTGAMVTVLHVHHRNIGPGPEDWDVLALRGEIDRCEVICPQRIFVLQKPLEWPFQHLMRPGVSILGSNWDRIMKKVRGELPFRPEGFESLFEAESAQIEETNRRFLLSIFGKGFALLELME
jgi:hypothetical protein